MCTPQRRSDMGILIKVLKQSTHIHGEVYLHVRPPLCIPCLYEIELFFLFSSRSVTGLGEFIFKSKHSIQITHAIETVVAKVKYTASPIPVSTLI